jgi:hypothetical protein
MQEDINCNIYFLRQLNVQFYFMKIPTQNNGFGLLFEGVDFWITYRES